MYRWFKFLFFIFFGYICVSEITLGSDTVIPEVNLTSKKALVKTHKPPLHITSITRKQIVESPSTDLSELLKQQQSIVRVTYHSSNTNDPVLSLRGFGDNAVANTLILVDGFPLTNSSLLAPQLNAFTLADVERIDIISGSQGVLWGDQAVGGVVNIITRHPQKFLTEGVVGLGSFNKKYLSIWLGNKFDNGFFFKASGFTQQTNNYRQHNQQEDNAFFTQAGIDYARGTLSLALQSYHDIFHFPGSLNQTQFNTHPRQATNFRNVNHLDTHHFQFFNQHELSADWMVETRLARQTTQSTGFTFFPYRGREWLNSIHPRLIGHLWKTKIILGYEAQNSHYQLINARTMVKANTQQNSLYTQAIVPLLEQLDFTLGSRLAYQASQAQQINGQYVTQKNRIFVTEQGLSFNPTQQWQFFLRRAGHFRFPKAEEAVWTPIQGVPLNPQMGVSYETGIAWHGLQHTMQLSLYQLKLHHEIAFDPTQTPSQVFGSFKNFYPTRRQGVTLENSYQLNAKIGLNAQLNYVDARFSAGPFSGNSIPAVPALNGNIGINYQWMSHWKIKTDAIYTGSQYASEDERNAGKKLPGYWLNSLAIQYMLKSLNISFEVINLFNRKYSTYTVYNPVNETQSYHPGAGRNYLLTFKVNLD